MVVEWNCNIYLGRFGTWICLRETPSAKPKNEIYVHMCSYFYPLRVCANASYRYSQLSTDRQAYMFHQILRDILTIRMLSFHMLKCPLKCAPAGLAQLQYLLDYFLSWKYGRYKTAANEIDLIWATLCCIVNATEGVSWLETIIITTQQKWAVFIWE